LRHEQRGDGLRFRQRQCPLKAEGRRARTEGPSSERVSEAPREDRLCISY
jgi:hypothetical protein